MPNLIGLKRYLCQNSTIRINSVRPQLKQGFQNKATSNSSAKKHGGQCAKLKEKHRYIDATGMGMLLTARTGLSIRRVKPLASGEHYVDQT